MGETIAFENIDAEMLEEQRLALGRVLTNHGTGNPTMLADLDLLEGLQNMLDAWSDGVSRRFDSYESPSRESWSTRGVVRGSLLSNQGEST